MSRFAVRLLQLCLSAVALVVTTGCSLESLIGNASPRMDVVLKNAPTEYSAVSDLQVQVSGSSISKYRYKLGLASATDCSDGTGYSTQTFNPGTPISDSMTPYAYQSVRLCVVALNAQGIQQSYSSASTVTWFVDVTPASVSVVEGEQSTTEVDSAQKAFTLNTSIAKPYPINVSYTLTGDATPGVDHNLQAAATVTIPAGQTTVSVPFRVYANALSSTSKDMYFVLSSADRNAQLVPNGRASRFLIYDTDGGARPTVASTGISPNGDQACALLSNGVLKCWGNNAEGQVGDGTTTNRPTPVTVDSGTSYSSFSIGQGTSCGITVAGVLKCWGSNTYNQLANGTTTASGTPTVIDSGVSYKFVFAATGVTVCGITSADVLKCWGYNGRSQVGDGTTVTKTVPTAVGGAVRFSSVYIFNETACGISTVATGRALYCWGGNFYGQVGIGTNVLVNSPTLVDSGVSYSSVKIGQYTTCGLTTASVLKCWGYNSHGQVGDGTTSAKNLPVIVDSGTTYSDFGIVSTNLCAITTVGVLRCAGNNSGGLIGDGTSTNRSPTIAIDVGTSYSKLFLNPATACAITSTGVLKCWGNNSFRQLGDGTQNAQFVPTVIDAGVSYSDIKALANVGSGTGLTCGVTTLGQMKCWGVNAVGQIGDGTATARISPQVIDTGVSYDQVVNNGLSTCAISSAGAMKCWGRNDTYAVGNNSSLIPPGPVEIDVGRKYQKVTANAATVCGITVDSDLKCWGYSGAGTAGNGSTANVKIPSVVDSGTKYKDVTTGSYVTCGITTAGVLKCWGHNSYGSVGIGTTVNQLTPAVIDSGTLYSSVWTDSFTTCGITTLKVLKCWGLGTSGQTGTGLTVNALYPTIVDPGVNYRFVATNNNTTCALTDLDVLKCWGFNTSGQIGNGGTVNVLSPTIVDSGTSYSQVTTYTATTCGITTAGILKCWGLNNGALGNGSSTATSTPTLIGAGTTFSSIKTNYQTCATTTTGLMKCWGDNSFGQVGDGTTLIRYSPVAVDSPNTYKALTQLNGNSTCGITTAGVLKCWGRNDYGQLGINVETFRPVPRTITKWLTP